MLKSLLSRSLAGIGIILAGLPPAAIAQETTLPPPPSRPSVWEQLSESLATPVGDFTRGDLLLSFGFVLLAFLLRNVVVRFVFSQLKRVAGQTRTNYDDRLIDSLEPPVSWFVFAVGIYLAIIILPIDEGTLEVASNIFKGTTMIFVVWGLLRMIDVGADVAAEVADHRGSSVASFMPLIKKAVRAFVLVIGIIMVVDNLGYSVGGVLATLGLGGAALAFAAKDTIANLYGSLALALDRPFKVGDWIMVGDRVDGDVEEIGLRSTKVRTWPKTVLSIPNSVLANEMINNWSRMPKRRVKQVVGVTYETKPDDMEGLVEDIRRLLREDDGVQQEFILVSFTDFGSHSLDILVYYFTVSTAWLVHMDVRQRVNLKIMRTVEARGLSVAFPTQTLYFEGDVARRMAGRLGGPGDGSLPGDVGPTEPA